MFIYKLMKEQITITPAPLGLNFMCPDNESRQLTVHERTQAVFMSSPSTLLQNFNCHLVLWPHTNKKSSGICIAKTRLT